MEGLDFGDWRAAVLAADAADWITVAAYGVAALPCLRAASAAARGTTAERTFWRLCALIMVLLGINEVFDFQTVLTAFGKATARAQGWYAQRRAVQLGFVIVLAAGAALTAAGALVLTRKAHRTVRLALLGLLFIGAFILFRAASFHHVDALLGLGPDWFNLGSFQEMAGIGIVAIAAYRYARRAGAAAA